MHSVTPEENEDHKPSLGDRIAKDSVDDQRKRRKVSENAHVGNVSAPTISSPVKPTPAKVPAAAQTCSDQSNDNIPTSITASTAAEKLHTAHKEVSPPPPRRSVNSLSTSAGLKTPIKPKDERSSIAVPSSSNPVAKKPVQTRKAETLNPRMLSHAPASHHIRLKLIQALHEHMARVNKELSSDEDALKKNLVMSEQEVIWKVLDEEENTARTMPEIYSNVIKNRILKLKRSSVKDWRAELEAAAKEKAAQEQAEGEKAALKTSVNELPVELDSGLSLQQELSLLPRIYTPLENLAKHGYVISVPSDSDIDIAREGIKAAKGWENCDRCKNRFQVFPGRREEDGALTSGGKCTYHWGKPIWQERDAKNPTAKRERKYRCCGEPVGDSVGCTQSDCHVFKVSEVKRLAALLNFIETPENPNLKSNAPVCVDCEMGYTVYGLEIIRLTATMWPHGEELLDVLVRPKGEVLDLNSRFSGVWPKQIAEAVPFSEEKNHKNSLDGAKKLSIVSSPAEARRLLLEHLSPRTPLIGHGLENDLNATRLIHSTVIDTALLYPHKAGLPYRNGLKYLMATHLNRNIQVVVDGKMDGHDSKEDANAAGDLVRWAVKNKWQKMQREGWKIVDGKLYDPNSLSARNPSHISRVESTLVEDHMSPPPNEKTGKKRTIDEVNEEGT
jgi:RNA exonuclease 1